MDNIPRPGDSDNNLLWKILQALNAGGGGGGGGGGAVTIADGADVALGSKSDLQVATPLSDPATLISLQRNIISLLGSIGIQLAVKANASQLPSSLGTKTTANSTAVNIASDQATAGAPLGVRQSDGSAFYIGAKTGQLPTALGQTTASGSTSVVLASDSQTVGGFTKTIKDTTAVSTSAYTAGDAVGAKRTLTGALRLSNGTAILESITLLDRSNQKAGMELFIFDSDPSAATITDNAAFVFSTDDLKVLARITIAATDYVTMDSKAIAQIKGLGVALTGANSNTSLYAALVTTGTPTYAATTDIQLIYGFLQD